MDFGTSLGFLAASASCVAIAFMLRWSLWQWLRRLPGSAHQLPAPLAQPGLRPAELAYLERDGDTIHTMLVLVVDLVQRIVKAGDEQPLALEPYEAVIFANVKDFVGKWAQGKIGEVIPVHDLRNPMQWLVRIRAIRAFFGNTLRGFFQELIKDPLHIRKYFSIGGIARFTLALCTTSARQAVEQSLRQELLARGLLVPPERSRRFAWLALMTIPLMVAATLIMRDAFFANSSLPAYIAVSVMGFLNAAGIRAILALPSLIPTYDEFNRIAAELPRASRRMIVVKALLRFSRVLIVWLTLISCVILLTIEFAIERFLMQVPIAQALPFLLGSTLISLPIVQALLDFHALSVRDHASQSALQAVHAQRRSLSNISPVDSLRSMLSDPQYEPQFSTILAIYGIETLWLLG